jgi:hypothetical protein
MRFFRAIAKYPAVDSNLQEIAQEPSQTLSMPLIHAFFVTLLSEGRQFHLRDGLAARRFCDWRREFAKRTDFTHRHILSTRDSDGSDGFCSKVMRVTLRAHARDRARLPAHG